MLGGLERTTKRVTEGFFSGDLYSAKRFYQPQSEYGMSWQNPDLGIQWPIKKPPLSLKDI